MRSYASQGARPSGLHTSLLQNPEGWSPGWDQEPGRRLGGVWEGVVEVQQRKGERESLINPKKKGEQEGGVWFKGVGQLGALPLDW